MSKRELAVGESMVTQDDGDLIVETTRTEETLFTTTYTDADTGELRLALQVDVTTGRTALDPRHIDAAYWTLMVEHTERPMSALSSVLAEIPNPSIEVQPEDSIIRVFSEEP